MKTKIKKIISKIKHICSNANYKIRYNNLVKKYNSLQEEYDKLELKLSAEYLNSQLNQARKEASMYKKQRDLVRQDYIDLRNSIKNKEN